MTEVVRRKRWPAVCAAMAAAGAFAVTPFVVRANVSRPTAAAEPVPASPTPTATSDLPSATPLPSPTPTPTVPPSTDPSGHDEVVPWADLPAGPIPDPVAAATPPAPTGPLCRSDQLRAEYGDAVGGTGHLFRSIEIRKVSGPACLLNGTVRTLTGRFDGGDRVSLVAADALPIFDPHPAVLRTASERGSFVIEWYPRCDEHGQRAYSSATDLRFELSSGAVLPVQSSDLATSIEYGCQPHSFPVSTSYVGGNPPEPAPPPLLPIASLRVRLDGPATVAAGATVDYVVTLTNASTRPVALEPCPSYVQQLGVMDAKTVTESHRLNCVAAHPLPPGSSESFAMRMDVPPDMPSGAGALMWQGNDKTWTAGLPFQKLPITVVPAAAGAPSSR